MAQRKQVLEESRALYSLKDLAQSYEEISVVRVQNIKESVLKTRDFLADLSDVFVDLKASYPREVKKLLELRKKGDKSPSHSLQKWKKSHEIFISLTQKSVWRTHTKPLSFMWRRFNTGERW